MSNFFNQLPNIIVGDPNSNSVPSNFVVTKNLFRRSKVIPEVLKNFTYFSKYTIPANVKPYQVSYDIYGSVEYEWILLIVNDITNVYNEWPLSDVEIKELIRTKYGFNQNNIKYWRTKEIKDNKGTIIVPKNLIVSDNYTYRLPNGEFIPKNELIEPVTYYDYEFELNESKRNIYILFPEYLERFITEYNQTIQYVKHEDLIATESNLKSSGNESYNRLGIDEFQ
jgi:hypothetical protein